MHRQKVAEVEKFTQTVRELEEAVLAGGAAANAVRDYQRKFQEMNVITFYLYSASVAYCLHWFLLYSTHVLTITEATVVYLRKRGESLTGSWPVQR